MGLFDRITGPVFLKRESDAERYLEELRELLPSAEGDAAEAMAKEIRVVDAGLYGERQVLFELENSHIPMLVIRDLYLEHDDLKAQIDFFIVTRKHQFVLECKNFFGDIEITADDEFIRVVKADGITKREGFYSPISQNRRHLDLMKAMLLEDKGLWGRMRINKNFDIAYRGAVVFTNPRTLLHTKAARPEIRAQVIRADQLAEYIRRVDSEEASQSNSEKEMESIAQFFLDRHKENPTDYMAKFRDMIAGVPDALPDEDIEEPILPDPEPEPAPEPEPDPIPPDRICPECGAPMVLRTATRGQTIGQTFYGCSRFPKCRCTLKVDEPSEADPSEKP